MKLTSIFTIVASFALPGSVLAQGPMGEQEGLKFMVGAGVISAPTYLGDDDYQISVFPNLSMSYGERLKASFNGIEYTVTSHGGWKVGALLGYDFGREERADGPFSITGDESTDLIGLGDIDGTIELGGFMEYEVGSVVAKLEARKGIDGGHEGMAGTVNVSYRTQINTFGRPTFVSIGPEISYADDNYNSLYFGVSNAQSIASGISEYDASGGVNSVGLHLSAMILLTRKASIVSFINYDQLTGDIGDSTIVAERGSKNQVTAGLFVSYRF